MKKKEQAKETPVTCLAVPFLNYNMGQADFCFIPSAIILT